MPSNALLLSARAVLRRWFTQATEPIVLFPIFALLVLSLIWGTTINLIKVERLNAERAAAASSRELVETYEAQMVRALTGIEQSLKFIKHNYEHDYNPDELYDLQRTGMLPPDLLFAVGITDTNGRILTSTRSFEVANVGAEEYFSAARTSDEVTISKPKKYKNDNGWELVFSRRIDARDGSFGGIVMIGVDAGYFVSGYEETKMGAQGLLGLLGTDGIYRALRAGDTVTAGSSANTAIGTVPRAGEHEIEESLAIDSQDGIQRYVSMRELYQYPLVVIAGLSRAEQMAATNGNRRTYVGWAIAGSILTILFFGLLGRMSWALAQSRKRAVKAQMEHAKRVEYLAYHDGLTGLPNRSLFSKLLQQGISQAHRYNRQLAVLFLDLDRFKYINDTLGHFAGDQLLQEVANRLRGCLRASDTVSRLGGDEFVVLLPEVRDDTYIAAVAEKILIEVARPFVLIGQEFQVTASVGVSVYPQDGMDEQTLTKNADIAMYQAKEQGKNNYQFYSEQLNAGAFEQLTMESNLRHALENNQFQLHYQARRDVRSDRIMGMEALLRWQHPDMGTVAPMHFIPLAESTGLILSIGKWVLKAACLQNVTWQRQGLPRLPIAVNLTARQFFDEHLARDLALILETTGMDAQYLELEITEKLIMQDTEKALQILAKLESMQIRIALDDFGIGYSSLFALKRFPLSTVKIGRSLLPVSTSSAEEKPSSARDQKLADSLVAIARASTATVVAQGIETPEQAELLREYAFDEFQGFYFGKPAPAEQFVELLRKHQNTKAKETLSDRG